MTDTATYNATTELLDRNIREGRGGKAAFIDRERRLTYGELQSQTARLANFLQRLGVRREECVAMIMLDTVDFPIVFLGAMRAGVVPVPLNTLLTAEQYGYILADTRARIAFVSEPLLATLEPVRRKLKDAPVIVVGGAKDELTAALAREADR